MKEYTLKLTIYLNFPAHNEDRAEERFEAVSSAALNGIACMKQKWAQGIADDVEVEHELDEAEEEWA